MAKLMFLPKRRLLVAATLSAAFLAACGGGGGSSAPAPEEVKALAGDEQIFVEWKEITGVQYWLWFKEGASVAVGDKNATAKVGSKGGGIDSPYLIDTVRTGTALTNGTAYSIVINGRTDGGEGGPGASPAGGPFTPRPAGATWNASTGFGGASMNGIAYGRSAGSVSLYSYVAVGDGGVIYSSDINNWTTLGSAATNTSETFNAIASSGGTLVAVGDKGTIRYSTNGTTWTTPASISEDISAINLRGVTYANGRWVAVGSNGKVLTSTSVGTWEVSTHSGDLTAVASGRYPLDGTAYYYLAVGADGTVLTSSDGITWTTDNVGAALRTAAVGTRLIALGDGSAWYRELAGTTWTAASGASGNMRGMIRAQHIYTAVGAAGASNHAY